MDSTASDSALPSHAQMGTAAPAKPGAARLFPLFALGAVCGISFWLGYGGATARPNGGLEVDANDLNFGEVWEHTEFVWPMTLRNPTSEAILVEGFYKSCSCVSVKPTSLNIPAGASAQITLTIDLHAAASTSKVNGADNTILSGRPVDIRLVPMIKSARFVSEGWTISGRAVRLLAAVPEALQIWDDLVRGMDQPALNMRLFTHESVEQVRALCNSEYARVRVIRANAAGLNGKTKTHDVAIELNARLPVGPLRFEIAFEPMRSADKRLPKLIVPVEGFVVEEVQALPRSIMFSSARVGGVLKETVVLQSRHRKDFHVTSVKCDSSDTTVERARGLGDDITAYVVTQKIATIGERTQMVHFGLLMKEDQRVITVPVSVFYHGLNNPNKTDTQR